MAKCRVTLIANAGVMIECNGAKVFSDALHRSKTLNFSAVDEQKQQRLFSDPAFKNADAMIFTHKHPDHYSKTLIAKMKQYTPGIELLSPVKEFDDMLLIERDEQRFKFKKFTVDFMRLTHSGAEYKNFLHYGFLLDFGGFTVLNTGDGDVANPALIRYLSGRRIDLALMPFPWLTLKSGRNFTEQFIKPRHVMYFHLPFAEDNISGYREFAFKALPLMTAVDDARLLSEPWQVEEII